MLKHTFESSRRGMVCPAGTSSALLCREPVRKEAWRLVELVGAPLALRAILAEVPVGDGSHFAAWRQLRRPSVAKYYFLGRFHPFAGCSISCAGILPAFARWTSKSHKKGTACQPLRPLPAQAWIIWIIRKQTTRNPERPAKMSPYMPSLAPVCCSSA